ncbi:MULTISPECIES: transporter [Curtobacterium]|uniref:SLAC1 family transporter n=1 Tax=Curtobacterium TaxID=2034 RepID=UPI0015F43544|nr:MULTISPECIES: transporter [Curtobacterium]MCS6560550.1 transporter [Curtobacterium flaccumfaciens pv. poinsettiae]UXN27537.1 transporter [Curtobacterium flaccumfaciens]
MQRTTSRIPLNTLAVPFGLAGFAETWSYAAPVLHLPTVVPQVFWAIAAIAWVWLLGAHAVRGARVRERLVDQLRHPSQGPIAALVPATAMLLGVDLARFVPVAGQVVVLAAVATAAGFAAWLLSTWFEGRLALESVHGGYLLPTVAAALVASVATHEVGVGWLSWPALGVGVFFWGVMTGLLLIRLAFRPALPGPLVPTMAILVAPPAVATLSVFALTDGAVTLPVQAIAGLGVLMVLVQLALLPRYVRLAFSLGFWSFVFPAAAVATAAVEWFRALALPSAWIPTAALLALLSVLVAVVGARSIGLAVHHLLGQAERTLHDADDEDAAPGPVTGATRVV